MGKDPRHFSIMSKEFVDDGKGNVCGVNTVQVEWKKDDSGRWNMSQVPGKVEVDGVNHLLALVYEISV